MGWRLSGFLPRAAVIGVLAVGATATLTYAAGQQLAATPAPPPPAPKPQTVVVPDIRNQAFVFAKGQLQDEGFAWRVSGGVRGYPANTVVAQSPAAGTKLVNTGAPLVTLTLARNAKYKQSGEPEDASSYHGTRIRSADLAVAPAAPAAKPKTKAPAAAVAPKPAAAKAPAAVTPKQDAASARPPAFVVPGAAKEPLDEMPLPDRATALATWLQAHPHKTAANVKHWLYQNEWILAGARMGWWRGAEALRRLIAVDVHAGSLWGVGAKSAAAARRALAEVEAKS